MPDPSGHLKHVYKTVSFTLLHLPGPALASFFPAHLAHHTLDFCSGKDDMVDFGAPRSYLDQCHFMSMQLLGGHALDLSSCASS